MENKNKNKKEKGLFIFHNDLRIVDNRGFIEASEKCKVLYCCFIFTPEQIGKSNSFRSNNAIQFMIESVKDLQEDMEGKLMIFYEKQTTVIKSLVEKIGIDCVFFNKFYTPYATSRDNETAEICRKMGIECKMFSDFYLYEPGTVLSGSGGIYKKFTPFYDAVIGRSVDKPLKKTIKNYGKITGSLDHEITLSKAMEKYVKPNTNILVRGGRKNGLQYLKHSVVEQKDYINTRDFLDKQTSRLSAYIKFGCVSIREVYHAFYEKYGVHHELIRQLIWRDFFAHVLYAYPETIDKSYYFQKIKWSNSSSHFEKWCLGKTGFPVVDACMRQLNTTGYMHNRGRMIVANFLVKTLLIDWRHGAKYFAQHLTDYDVASNQENWQNIASTGVYSTPYFRDMSPWIQSKKLDKDAVFTKTWLPELKDVLPNDIHRWDCASIREKYSDIDYKPMVNYREQKEKMMKMYSSV